MVPVPPWSKTTSTVVPLSSATHVPVMSLLKKKNQPAPMATTATTATITQVKGLFVVAVVVADVAEATWVPVGAGVVWEGQAWLGWLFVKRRIIPRA